MSPRDRTRIALASLAFGVGAPLGYVGQRTYERSRGAILSPFRVLRDLHVGYFYRVAIATFLGIVVAFLASSVLQLRAPGHADADARAAAIASLVATFVIAALAYGLP